MNVAGEFAGSGSIKNWLHKSLNTQKRATSGRFLFMLEKRLSGKTFQRPGLIPKHFNFCTYLFIIPCLNEREKKLKFWFLGVWKVIKRMTKSGTAECKTWQGIIELKGCIRVTDEASFGPKPYEHRASLEGERCPKQRNLTFYYKPDVGLGGDMNKYGIKRSSYWNKKQKTYM